MNLCRPFSWSTPWTEPTNGYKPNRLRKRQHNQLQISKVHPLTMLYVWINWQPFSVACHASPPHPTPLSPLPSTHSAALLAPVARGGGSGWLGSAMAKKEARQNKLKFAQLTQIPTTISQLCQHAQSRTPSLPFTPAVQRLSQIRPTSPPSPVAAALCIMRQLLSQEACRQVGSKATSCSQGVTRQRLAHFHFPIRQPQNFRWTLCVCVWAWLELALAKSAHK